jgi:hypothetical protein
MNRVAKIGLGCLLLPVGTTVLGLLFFLTMKAAGVPDPSVTEKEFAQEIGTQLVIEDDGAGSTTERIDDTAALSRIAAQTAVIVDIDVEECEFFLESGPAEEGVRIEANYDEATYELTQSYDLDGDIPVFRLKFRSKISFWRRIAQDGSFSDDDFSMNSITVFLPADTPIALRSRVAKGEGELRLDDLVLTDLVTTCSMGAYTVEMATPNPVVMESASLSMGMGEATFRGLSNLRARSVRVEGGMGEARIDFGNSLLVDTELIARMKMGEMVIEVPDDALYDPQSRVKATMGEVSNGMDRGQRVDDPELAKRISLDASVLMGEIQLDPFRVRPSSRIGN